MTETAALRIAEAERDNVARRLNEHARTCQQRNCPDCRSLRRHLARTEHQVTLLASPAAAEQVLF